MDRRGTVHPRRLSPVRPSSIEERLAFMPGCPLERRRTGGPGRFGTVRSGALQIRRDLRLRPLIPQRPK